MNNEDKILTLLEQMNARHDRTESLLEKLVSEQQKTNQRLDKLEQGQAKLEQRQTELEQEIRHTRVMLEETQHEVKIIAEGYLSLDRKLDLLLKRYDAEADVRALKLVVAQHSRDIEELKMAK